MTRSTKLDGTVSNWPIFSWIELSWTTWAKMWIIHSVKNIWATVLTLQLTSISRLIYSNVFFMVLLYSTGFSFSLSFSFLFWCHVGVSWLLSYHKYLSWMAICLYCFRTMGTRSLQGKIRIYFVFRKRSVVCLSCQMRWKKLLGTRRIGFRVKRRVILAQHCFRRSHQSKSHMASVKYIQYIHGLHHAHSLISCDKILMFDIWTSQVQNLSISGMQVTCIHIHMPTWLWTWTPAFDECRFVGLLK